MLTITARETLAAMRGTVVHAEQLRALRLSRHDLDQLRARGEVHHLRRSWYLVAPAAAVRAADLYAARVRATVSALGDGVILAGPAAAVWWGLPWVGQVPARVTVCGESRTGGSATHLRRIGVPGPGDVVRHNGALVTRVARSVIDTARVCEGRSALAIADAALQRALVERPALDEALEGVAGRHGAGSARWCVHHADGRAENAGESVSRHAIICRGLPVPELQVEVVLPDGSVARIDMNWDLRVPVDGEFDGRCKYGRVTSSGKPAAEVVYREKRREDALRAMGRVVTRWTWDDAWRPAAWLDRLSVLLSTNA